MQNGQDLFHLYLKIINQHFLTYVTQTETIKKKKHSGTGECCGPWPWDVKKKIKNLKLEDV